MLIRTLGISLISTLYDSLRTNINPTSGRHLTVHHQSLFFQFTEMIPVCPIGYQLRIADQHPRRVLVRRQNGNRFSALNHQRFIVVQVQQSPTDIVKRRPIARCLSQTAVYNQIFRTFSHFGIQVVVQHAICRFLNPTFTIQFAARGRLQYP